MLVSCHELPDTLYTCLCIYRRNVITGYQLVFVARLLMNLMCFDSLWCNPHKFTVESSGWVSKEIYGTP